MDGGGEGPADALERPLNRPIHERRPWSPAGSCADRDRVSRRCGAVSHSPRRAPARCPSLRLRSFDTDSTRPACRAVRRGAAALQPRPHGRRRETAGTTKPPLSEAKKEQSGGGGSGADDGIRTRDPHLGKVVLYQLSHVRVAAMLPHPWLCCKPSAALKLSQRTRTRRPAGRAQRPVEPKPSSPRSASGSASTSMGRTVVTCCTTSWAIRSPGSSVTVSSGSRLTTMTLTSPR